MTDEPILGASPAAIAAHYDLGNDFFRLWLDPSMTYTCALWDSEDPSESLEKAQVRKTDRLLEAAGARGAARLLDVGCGWGGALARCLDHFEVGSAHGLTLSPNQAAWITEAGQPGLTVALESWADHQPASRYDAIISVEAFEAFSRRDLAPGHKVAIYRQFFERCHDWLKPGGAMALQTIAYGNAGPEDFDDFIAAEVFPESDLPQLADIARAIERRFEVVTLHNRRQDYVRTLRAWLARLKHERERAVEVVGEDVVVRFERYLRLSIFMFDRGTCDLFQFTLHRIDHPRFPPCRGDT